VRVIGYVRVSTEEQSASGAGLLAQRTAISSEAQRRGWELLEIVEDAGFSGRDLRRPGIGVVLDALKARRASALMVAKLDRLSRSMLDFAALMDRSTREGWALVAIDLGVDTTTPAGEALANVMLSFAVFERRLIAQRTKEAMAAKRAAGVRFGRPRTIPAPVLARITAERGGGLTYRAIADLLTADRVPTGHGGRRWYASTVHAALRCAAMDSPVAPPPSSVGTVRE
jgi:DNA invertase Pin-like site-specific DNA recombinase